MHALVPGILSTTNPISTAVESSADDGVPVVVSGRLAPQVAMRTQAEGSVQTWSERLKPQLLNWNSPGIVSRPFMGDDFVQLLSTTAVAPSLQLQKVRWQI